MSYQIIADSCGDFTEEMKANPVFKLVPLPLEIGDYTIYCPCKGIPHRPEIGLPFAGSFPECDSIFPCGRNLYRYSFL